MIIIAALLRYLGHIGQQDLDDSLMTLNASQGQLHCKPQND